MMATGNTEGKGSSGAKFRVPPANVWNNMVDAGNAYALSKLDSPGGPPTRPRATDIIKIQNTSGAARRTGEILKIEGKALDTITAEHIWLIGVETTEDCYFGILRKPVADDGIEQLQVSGACLALVDIADVEHTKAKVAVGSYVLESSDSGPLEILYAPETTGEQTCVVRFAGGGGGGGHSIWGTVEEVVCLEEGTYCWVTVTEFSGKCGEIVPGKITDTYDEHFDMIKVEQVCEIFMAYYTEAQLTGKVIEAGLFWRRDEETNECLPTWLVRQVCGLPECA